MDPEILQHRALTKLVRSFKAPNLALLAAGIMPRRTILGQKFEWDVVPQKRDIGAFVHQGGHSVVREKEITGTRAARLANAFFSIPINPATLQDLRNPGSEDRQKVSQDEVGRQMAGLARDIDRMKQFTLAAAIQDTLTITINGKTYAIPFGVSAAHKPTIGVGVSDWSNPASDILSDIDSIVQLNEQDSGFTPKIAITSREVMTEIMTNTVVKDYFDSTPDGVEYMRTGIVAQFKGLRWIPINETYKPVGGAVTRFIDKKKVIFLPEPDPEWAEFIEGGVTVPREDHKSTEERPGRQAWHIVSDDPAQDILLAAESFLPVIYNADALTIATVLP